MFLVHLGASWCILVHLGAQETKMVVPSDPNGLQFNLPGEAQDSLGGFKRRACWACWAVICMTWPTLCISLFGFPLHGSSTSCVCFHRAFVFGLAYSGILMSWLLVIKRSKLVVERDLAIWNRAHSSDIQKKNWNSSNDPWHMFDTWYLIWKKAVNWI